MDRRIISEYSAGAFALQLKKLYWKGLHYRQNPNSTPV